MATPYNSFMLRSDFAELAKTVNSITASVSTVFLFTRLWARSKQMKGLWWDDYLLIAAWIFQLIANGLFAAAPAWGFNITPAGHPHAYNMTLAAVSSFYVALASSKSAFAVALIRLSSGKIQALLYCITIVVWAYNIAVAVCSWLPICGLESKAAARLPHSRCVSMEIVIWINMGNSMFMIITDLVFAYLPWQIVSMVSIPRKEKWSVGGSLSLVGLAACVCIARVVIQGQCQAFSKLDLDYSYGAVTVYCLAEVEVAIYIVAQTIPVLRVVLQGDDSAGRRPGMEGQDHKNKRIAPLAKSTPRVFGEELEISPVRESLELVVLPSGKVVAADSSEGISVRASHGRQKVEPEELGESSPVEEDEVHQVWEKMGYSKRAWSPPIGSRNNAG